MKISLIISTFNRGCFLKNSLETWFKQKDFDLANDFELILIDDGSIDDTRQIIDRWENKANIKYIKLENEIYRAHTVGYNIGLKNASHEICLFTHPEIMFDAFLLKKLSDKFEDREIIKEAKEIKAMDYVTIKPLWLPEVDIDTVNWKENIYQLCNFLDFAATMEGLPIDYRPQTQMQRDEWGSTTCFAMLKKDLLDIKGFHEFDCWGPDDIVMAKRRRIFQMNDIVLGNCFVFHQNHDNHHSSKRLSMKEVFAKVPEIKTITEAYGAL